MAWRLVARGIHSYVDTFFSKVELVADLLSLLVVNSLLPCPKVNRDEARFEGFSLIPVHMEGSRTNVIWESRASSRVFLLMFRASIALNLSALDATP